MKKISLSRSALFLFIFFRVWVLCFRTINEKKKCTGSGICIISLAASTTTARPPSPHSLDSTLFLSCFASSDIWGASTTRGEMKQEVKIDFLHFMEDIRGLNHVLITMSSLKTINWNFLVFKNIFHSSNLKKSKK